jgi:hypothetical protein
MIVPVFGWLEAPEQVGGPGRIGINMGLLARSEAGRHLAIALGMAIAIGREMW